jgi:transcriptional regulator with XRE-family HTH domain
MGRLTLMERIARNVKRRRDARGWAQQELADRLEVRRAYVTQIESGARGVSIEVLEKLARVFRVKVGTLLE